VDMRRVDIFWPTMANSSPPPRLPRHHNKQEALRLQRDLGLAPVACFSSSRASLPTTTHGGATEEATNSHWIYIYTNPSFRLPASLYTHAHLTASSHGGV